jgi:hypothetical protein
MTICVQEHNKLIHSSIFSLLHLHNNGIGIRVRVKKERGKDSYNFCTVSLGCTGGGVWMRENRLGDDKSVILTSLPYFLSSKKNKENGRVDAIVAGGQPFPHTLPTL